MLEKLYIDKVRAKYSEKCPDGLEIRVIAEGVSRASHDDEWESWIFLDVFESGWRFDHSVSLWKPPEVFKNHLVN